jgi:hypothetical protein
MMITIALDQGAGNVKAARISEGQIGASVEFPSLVYEAPAAIDPMYFDQPGVMAVMNGSNRQFLVGNAVREQIGGAIYDTAHSRYTSEDEMLRFYAATGSLLPPGHPSQATDIRLVVGLNVKAYQSYSQRVANFYHRRHTFALNRHTFALNVTDVLVTSQPRGAWKSIVSNPPARLAERAERLPLADALGVLCDIGNLTTDVLVFDAGSEIYEKGFALTSGVQTLRDEVARIVGQAQGDPDPPLSAVDRALATGKTVDAAGNIVNIKTQIEQKAAAIWERIYRTIRTKLDGVKPHYLVAVGGGAEVFRPHLEKTWGHLPGFAIPDEPGRAVVNGYALLAMEKWRWA